LGLAELELQSPAPAFEVLKLIEVVDRDHADDRLSRYWSSSAAIGKPDLLILDDLGILRSIQRWPNRIGIGGGFDRNAHLTAAASESMLRVFRFLAPGGARRRGNPVSCTAAIPGLPPQL
jgi:hypothetical protein